MTFYGINYIESQSSFNDYIKYGIIFLALIFMMVAFSLYMRHRIQTKYRDLSIMFFLLLVFMLGVQYSDYAQNQSRYTQSSQMVAFIKEVAQEFDIKQEDVLVNSVQFTDGVVVKIQDTYYTVNLSADQSSYRLTETYLMNTQVEVNK
ncbi:DUF3290 domain-containing protein [Enterococcus pallens]|uniref:DUF3290 domain-containing protein n=1 Tax=Enterococcus pallens ATCC BAA-351 TaxID=1158607 RepID=R2T030_9ENTE|nr:DUF3290 domain-containing protein [Enterococcus pallens]EOH93639.1 hypothetical protein UAU_02335 [Enterococcus pallens ATCC BAA-351]EOU24479.1 hypothetical protein I588_00466 [Enterococcus pallens ATCC BAA-351]OJG78636.1 hypothetical protein RV10_GL001418 [Enterococcus pallens]